MFTEMEMQGPEISQPDIDKLETFLDKKLPTSYKGFLLEFNGGEPIECAFDFDGEKLGISGATIATFYEVSDDVSYGIQPNIENHSDLVPEDCFVIATTPAGNYVFMSLAGESEGQVFYKDHEVESLGDFNPSGGLLPDSVVALADSFEAFLGMLYDPDE